MYTYQRRFFVCPSQIPWDIHRYVHQSCYGISREKDTCQDTTRTRLYLQQWKRHQDIRLVSLSFNTFIPRLKQVPSFPSCPLVLRLISTSRTLFQMGSPPQYRNNGMCDFHIGTTDQCSRTSTLLLRRHTLLFQETNIAADNVPENTV